MGTLRIIVILSILFGDFTVYSQTKDTLIYPEYLIQTSKINFHFKDSLYPYTLFVEPDGRFYFKTNFVEGGEAGIRTIRVDFTKAKKKHTLTADENKVEVYKRKSDSISIVESLFPKLIVNDSSFINGYPFEFELLPLIKELDYSFILNNLNEPSLYACVNKRAIRVVIPDEGVKNPGRYYSIRVEFGNGKTKLNYSGGDFDKEGKYQIIVSKTCTLSEKDAMKVEGAIKKINFSKEYYFVKATLDTKYLIEYRDGDKYYALERPLYRKEYQTLWLTLASLAWNRKCKE